MKKKDALGLIKRDDSEALERAIEEGYRVKPRSSRESPLTLAAAEHGSSGAGA